jgi:hypothetical protein
LLIHGAQNTGISPAELLPAAPSIQKKTGPLTSRLIPDQSTTCMLNLRHAFLNHNGSLCQANSPIARRAAGMSRPDRLSIRRPHLRGGSRNDYTGLGNPAPARLARAIPAASRSGFHSVHWRMS